MFWVIFQLYNKFVMLDADICEGVS